MFLQTQHCIKMFFSGLVPRRIRLLADQFNESLKVSKLMVSSKQESVKKLLQDYYVSLCQHLTIVSTS